MVEVSATEAARRLEELVDSALRGEDVVIVRGSSRIALSPMQPPLDVEAHLAAIRKRLAGPAPPPTAAELDADFAAMRGRD